MPMYLGGRNGYDLQKLQRAYTDFDKIHVVAPYQSGQSHLTIIKKQEGPRALEASEKVSARANNVLAVRKTFGHTAAVAAYGQKLESAPRRRGFPGTRRYSLPNWDKAEEAIPLPEETGLQAARDQLNSQRYVAFSSSNNSAKLGIRLLEDGTQEVKWFVNSAPVFVPHP
ncbi:hypothetical protein [Sporisorium scitamineum]|nr:hypothetical protein [Sporisorium scitamineum]